jgi:hypothetical protein
MCGFELTTWQTFSDACFCLHGKPVEEGLPKSIFVEYYGRVSTVYAMRRATVRSVIADLLRRSASAKCSGLSDKIFALLGMTRENMDIEPAHEKTINQVYQDLALTFFDFYHLFLLIYCDLGTHSVVMPTWVPNCTAKSLNKPINGQEAAAHSVPDIEYVCIFVGSAHANKDNHSLLT